MELTLQLNKPQEELIHMIKRLKDISSLPEVYINEYFASLRNEIDGKAERLLAELDPVSGESISINTTREVMINQLGELEQKCIHEISHRPIPQSETASKYNLILNSINEKYNCLSKDKTELEHIKDLADLMQRIRNQLLDTCCTILRNCEVLFVENNVVTTNLNQTQITQRQSRAFGHLLEIRGTKLADSEIKWIKYFYKKQSNKTKFTCKKIIKDINSWESLKQGLLFDSQMPPNLVVLEEIARRGRNAFRPLQAVELQLRKEDIVIDDAVLRTLTNASFSKLKNLKTIELSSCMIERVAPDTFKGLENLVSINFKSNKIKTIDSQLLANTKLLRGLYLSQNLIDAIDVQAFINCLNLTRIDLSSNWIDMIDLAPFSQLPELKYLYLSNNRIYQISSNSSKVTNTDEADSDAVELVVTSQTNSKLIVLKLDNNKLTCINKDDFSSFKSLKLLDCSHNQIANIDQEAFYSLDNLTELSMNSNLIEDFSENLIIKNQNLKRLKLKENRLKELRSSRKIILNVLELDEHVKIHNIEQRGDFCVMFFLRFVRIACCILFALIIFMSVFSIIMLSKRENNVTLNVNSTREWYQVPYQGPRP